MPRYHSRAKFNRLNELNKMIDAGGEYAINARATKKALTQSWGKRTMNPGDMYKSRNRKPSEVRYV